MTVMTDTYSSARVSRTAPSDAFCVCVGWAFASPGFVLHHTIFCACILTPNPLPCPKTPFSRSDSPKSSFAPKMPGKVYGRLRISWQSPKLNPRSCLHQNKQLILFDLEYQVFTKTICCLWSAWHSVHELYCQEKAPHGFRLQGNGFRLPSIKVFWPDRPFA